VISRGSCLFIIALATGVCGSLRAQSAPTVTAAAPTARTITVTATLEAFETADLYAKDSGYLSEVKADLGDHVKQGQVLAVIDDPELQKQIDSAQALNAARQEQATAAQAAIEQTQRNRDVVKSQLVGYQAELALSRATLSRQEELFAAKAITNQQVDETRAKMQVAAAQADVAAAKVAAAEADISAAQANLAVAGSQVAVAAAEVERLKTLLQYTRITAPFDGVITRRMVSRGDLVQSGAANRTTPLFACQRLDTIRVFCDVPETSAAAISAGTPASVKIPALDGQSVTGAVTRIATSLNAATRTMRAEIDLPNPGEKLRPGMYAQVTLTVVKQ
jgi:multidrug efflux pump subunit AcrA (membrane-fusion protein)